MDEKKIPSEWRCLRCGGFPEKWHKFFRRWQSADPVFINPGERRGFMKRVFYAGFAGSRHMWLQRLVQDKYDASDERDIFTCLTTIAKSTKNRMKM